MKSLLTVEVGFCGYISSDNDTTLKQSIKSYMSKFPKYAAYAS